MSQLYYIQPEDTSMPEDVTVSDNNSSSEKYNEEKEDSEIGRSNYYLIKANNTKWQAEQQTRDIRTGQTIPMTERNRDAKNVQAQADCFKCFIHHTVTNRTKYYQHKH